MGARGESLNDSEALMQRSMDANNLFPLALMQSSICATLSPEQRKGLLGRLLHTHKICTNHRRDGDRRLRL
jgi:hypothetical protein